MALVGQLRRKVDIKWDGTRRGLNSFINSSVCSRSLRTVAQFEQLWPMLANRGRLSLTLARNN